MALVILVSSWLMCKLLSMLVLVLVEESVVLGLNIRLSYTSLHSVGLRLRNTLGRVFLLHFSGIVLRLLHLLVMLERLLELTCF